MNQKFFQIFELSEENLLPRCRGQLLSTLAIGPLSSHTSFFTIHNDFRLDFGTVE